MTDIVTENRPNALHRAVPSVRGMLADGDSESGLLAGFTDPVKGAQSTFRSLLKALSHPGTIIALGADATDTGMPRGLSAAMTAMLLTLVDCDTPLWLPPRISEATRQFLRFHCACQFVETPGAARFVAIPAGFSPPALNTCHQGDPTFPDRSATLIIEVEALHAPTVAQTQNGEPSFVLTGPGIEHTQALAVHGLPDDFLQQWRRNHQHFPLGVDVFFSCDQMVCGLPRTTRVEN